MSIQSAQFVIENGSGLYMKNDPIRVKKNSHQYLNIIIDEDKLLNVRLEALKKLDNDSYECIKSMIDSFINNRPVAPAAPSAFDLLATEPITPTTIFNDFIKDMLEFIVGLIRRPEHKSCCKSYSPVCSI